MKTFEEFCAVRNADPMMSVKIDEQDYKSIKRNALVEVEAAIYVALIQIESDAVSCEMESARFKAAKDEVNAYLMGTQAMAHRLDLEKVKKGLQSLKV